MHYSHKYLLNEVLIVYDEELKKYRVKFHKVIQNIGNEPLQLDYARVAVKAFPEDPELTRSYYRKQPLSLQDISFLACDEKGEELAYQIQHEDDSNIELNILFTNLKTQKRSPIYPGKQKKFFYQFDVNHMQWGPFIRRHVRVPCEELRICLIFPKGLVEVWGDYINPSSGAKQDIVPEIETREQDNRVEFKWGVHQPAIGAKYQLSWAFTDERHEESKHLVQQLVNRPDVAIVKTKPENAHSEDFRSVVWNETPYQFTVMQAACVRVLYEAWEKSTFEIGQTYILDRASSKCDRLIDVFRTNNKQHPAWGTMIIRGKKRGTYRLA